MSWKTGRNGFKGYVACDINYTLRTDDNGVSVLDQSNEIKAAVPKVVAAAEDAGYHIWNKQGIDLIVEIYYYYPIEAIGTATGEKEEM